MPLVSSNAVWMIQPLFLQISCAQLTHIHWVVLPFLPLRPVELHFLGVSNHAAMTSCCLNFIFKWLHRRCFTFIEFLLPSPIFSTWNLNISHWKRRFRTWKPLWNHYFQVPCLKLWGYTLEIGTCWYPNGTPVYVPNKLRQFDHEVSHRRRCHDP